MSNFREVLLGEICNIEIGGTPSRSKEHYWWNSKNDGRAFPWVSISDMKDKVITQTKESITQAGVDNSNCKMVPEGTLLMSFKLSIGKLAFAGKDLFTNEAIAAIIPDHQVSPDFLYYGLQYWNLTGDIDQAIKGVTLNKQKLLKIPCLIPSLAEQNKIVEILSQFDENISLYRGYINKLQLLKKGFSEELLSGKKNINFQL